MFRPPVGSRDGPSSDDRRDDDRRPLRVRLSLATMTIWSVATIASIFGPTMVTGSDPTTIPLAAIIAPVAAVVGTAITGIVVLTVSRLGRTAG